MNKADIDLFFRWVGRQIGNMILNSFTFLFVKFWAFITWFQCLLDSLWTVKENLTPFIYCFYCFRLGAFNFKFYFNLKKTPIWKMVIDWLIWPVLLMDKSDNWFTKQHEAEQHSILPKQITLTIIKGLFIKFNWPPFI